MSWTYLSTFKLENSEGYNQRATPLGGGIKQFVIGQRTIMQTKLTVKSDCFGEATQIPRLTAEDFIGEDIKQ